MFSARVISGYSPFSLPNDFNLVMGMLNTIAPRIVTAPMFVIELPSILGEDAGIFVINLSEFEIIAATIRFLVGFAWMFLLVMYTFKSVINLL